MKFGWGAALAVATLCMTACGPAGAPPAPPTPATGPTSGAWAFEEPIDQLTDQRTYLATRIVHPDAGVLVEMKAVCSTDALGKSVRMDIVFFDDKDQGLDVDRKGQERPMARVNQQFGGAPSWYGIQEHTNDFILYFSNETWGDAAPFLQSNFSKVEIPLMNGSNVVIDLLPQDAALRQVFSRCFNATPPTAAAPAPAAATPAPDNDAVTYPAGSRPVLTVPATVPDDGAAAAPAAAAAAAAEDRGGAMQH